MVWYQAAAGQLLDDGLVSASDATRCVNVFYAQQPLALVGTRIQPARQCASQGARMQRTSGGGGEAAYVMAVVQLFDVPFF